MQPMGQSNPWTTLTATETWELVERRKEQPVERRRAGVAGADTGRQPDSRRARPSTHHRARCIHRHTTHGKHARRRQHTSVTEVSLSRGLVSGIAFQDTYATRISPTTASGVNSRHIGFLATGAQCDILLNCAL